MEGIFLSFGGCLIVIKSILSSLHVYAFSFFIAPSGIISYIESMFNKKNRGVGVRIIGKLHGLVGILFVIVRRNEV